MDKKLSALRISLTLAVAAMLGVLALACLELRPKIQTLSKEREAFKVSAELNLARASQAESDARELSQRLVEAQAQTDLALRERKHTEAENARLLIDLEEARAALHLAKQEIARWNATGATPDQVASLAGDNKALTAQLSQLQTHYDRLSRQLADAIRILDPILKDPDVTPELPPMHRSVLVVDPKWSFVVLDLGKSHGLVKNGVLMISRDGKLIGKAKVRRVEAERCIADLLPGWRVAEVREGDQVMN